MGTTLAYKIEEAESSNTASARSYFFELESKLMSEKKRNTSIDEIERELHSGILELGRRLMQEHIEKRGAGYVGESIIRNDGKELNNKRLKKRHLETIFGRVKNERLGYGHKGESSIFPKDEKMKLPERIYSYPLQQKVSREAVRSSYDEIDETLSEYTGSHVPKRQSLEIVKDAAEDFELFYKQRSSERVESQGRILVYTADGKGIPMREEGLREETRKRFISQKLSNRRCKGEKKHRKREALVASVYNIEPHVRSAKDIMEEFSGDKKKLSSPPRPENKRVWASLEKEKEDVYYEMLDEGKNRIPKIKTAAFLCDGAKVLQDLGDEILRPQFKETEIAFFIILDLLHVLGYLWKAAYAFYPEGDRRIEEWVDKYLRMLLDGKASIVAGTIRRSATQNNLRGNKRSAVDNAADYFLRNKEYMRYNEYLELGLPIATGVIEGACKHLVKDRFEISGARWGLDGGEALLKLRSIYKSGDWQEYWDFHIDSDQERIHYEDYWKPLEKPKTAPKLTLIQGGKSCTK